MSNWFWDMRTNWDPTSASWSDPRSLLGYIAQGFEGGLGAFSATKDAKTYVFVFENIITYESHTHFIYQTDTTERTVGIYP